MTAYNIHDYDVPLTTVDIAIFTVNDGILKVLLHKRPNEPELGKWALAGGFCDLENDVNIDATAYRKLNEKTGVSSSYLEQVCTVGNATRDIRGWAVTILYFALIPYQLLEKNISTGSALFDTSQLNTFNIGFDHRHLIELAIARMRNKIRYSAIAFGLAEDTFTLTELQHLFEVLLGYSIEAKSFRRRMLDNALVKPIDAYKRAGKRNAQLFTKTIDSDQYEFNRLI